MTGDPSPPGLDAADAVAFERCIAAGGVAIFPADTVYGLAVDPENADAVRRLNELKRRDPAQPSGVMFFSPGSALAALAGLAPATRTAVERLLPGPLTLVLPNPSRRFPLACGASPERLGIRVPQLTGPLLALAAVDRPVLQSSANLHGGVDPQRFADVPTALHVAADLALDGGMLPGIASTVVDLSDYENDGSFAVLREGAFPAEELEERLSRLR